VTIFDLIWLSDIDLSIEFDGDGVDYFDNRLVLKAKQIPIECTAIVTQQELTNLLTSLENLTKQLKDQL